MSLNKIQVSGCAVTLGGSPGPWISTACVRLQYYRQTPGGIPWWNATKVLSLINPEMIQKQLESRPENSIQNELANHSLYNRDASLVKVLKISGCEASALHGTSSSPPSRLGEHLHKKGPKESKSWRIRRSAVRRFCLLMLLLPL